jgi:copper chaperone CopZ
MTIAATEQRKAEAIFSLFNLRCVSCSNVVESKLKKLHGIKKVSVDCVTDTVHIEFDPTLVTTDAIRAFLTKLGQKSKRR